MSLRLSSDITIDLVEYTILCFLDFMVDEFKESNEIYIHDNKDSFHRDACIVLDNAIKELENRLASLTIDNTVHYDFDEVENKIFPSIILRDEIAREDLFFIGISFIDFLDSMILDPNNKQQRNSKNIICEDKAGMYRLIKESLIWRLETICEE